MINSFLFYYYTVIFVLLARDAMVRDVVWMACKSGSYFFIKKTASVVINISKNTIFHISRSTRNLPQSIPPPDEAWTLVEH